MQTICPKVDSYEQFAQVLLKKLAVSNQENVLNYKDFIQANLTSTRASKMKEQLRQAGIVC